MNKKKQETQGKLTIDQGELEKQKQKVAQDEIEAREK